MTINNFTRFARQLGIETVREFDPQLLVPEARITAFCRENKCGNYGTNYMCPPLNGSREEIQARLRRFQHGILLQYSGAVDVQHNRDEVVKTKVEFHRKVLQLEELLKGEGVKEVWGMIGGSCGLCDVCLAKVDQPCPHPGEARMSMEAAGIDVLSLLDRLGIDNRFLPDRITWTGCVLSSHLW